MYVFLLCIQIRIHFNFNCHEWKYWHEKSHCLDIRGKRNDTVKGDNGRQQSELEGVLDDVICQEDGSLCYAAEPPNIIRQDDKSVSEKVPSSLIEVVNILLPAEKKGE